MKKNKEENRAKLLKEEVLVHVSDNWCGNYEGDMIRVHISLNWIPNLDYHFVRIGAWGNDDLGMIKDFDNPEYETLLQKYNELCETFLKQLPKTVSQEWFLEQGFEYF